MHQEKAAQSWFDTDSQLLFLNFRLQLCILGILVAAVVDEHRIRDM